MLLSRPSPRAGAQPSLRAGEDWVAPLARLPPERGAASPRCVSHWSEGPPETVERLSSRPSSLASMDPVGELYRSADHHVWELVENEMVTQEESGDRCRLCPEKVALGRWVKRFLTCSHAQIGSLDPHTLTTTDANGQVAAGVGIHLHQESRYGVYVTALTPGGPGHFACPIGDSGIIIILPHECATMLSAKSVDAKSIFADAKSVFCFSAAEECGLISQDDVLRSVDGCVICPLCL